MFFDRLLEFDLSLVTAEEMYMMGIGYLVVFIVLTILFIVFQRMPGVIELAKKSKAFLSKRKDSIVSAAENTIGRNGHKNPEKPDKKEVLSGEVNAAISAAIHLYVSESHDDESTILTIEKVSRRYSPWSSKIYSVTNLRR